MSRESRKKAREAEARERAESAASYYELKTQAVEDLVSANEENSPPVSREEIRKYTSRGRLKLADWVKLLAIKWWFAAAVCFFFLWNKEKLITVHPTSFEMSLSSHLDLPNVCREEGNRLTGTQSVMTRWLKSWLGLWPPGIEGLGGDFIFLTDDQPESHGHVCQSTAGLQGSTWSLASPLGHILCKKSP